MKSQYLSLEALAATLGLPQGYLRNLASEGQIPFLDVNGRKRFYEEDVRDALKKMTKDYETTQKKKPPSHGVSRET